LKIEGVCITAAMGDTTTCLDGAKDPLTGQCTKCMPGKTLYSHPSTGMGYCLEEVSKCE
jgi:hypothetical protein